VFREPTRVFFLNLVTLQLVLPLAAILAAILKFRCTYLDPSCLIMTVELLTPTVMKIIFYI